MGGAWLLQQRSIPPTPKERWALRGQLVSLKTTSTNFLPTGLKLQSCVLSAQSPEVGFKPCGELRSHFLFTVGFPKYNPRIPNVLLSSSRQAAKRKIGVRSFCSGQLVREIFLWFFLKEGKSCSWFLKGLWKWSCFQVVLIHQRRASLLFITSLKRSFICSGHNPFWLLFSILFRHEHKYPALLLSLKMGAFKHLFI